MKAAKTETLTVRVEPSVKAGLKSMAEQERCSLANMIEVMIRDYRGRNDVEIADLANDPSPLTRNRQNNNDGYGGGIVGGRHMTIVAASSIGVLS